MTSRWGVFAWLMVFACVSSASDLLREQRMADQIRDAILVGEPVTLEAGDVDFLGIHAESELNQVYGGVIVVHGRGAHPDWMEVINPLRSELPAQGWETLSIQMPIAEVGADNSVYQSLVPEAFPRITAAVDFFKQRKIKNIVVVSHSLGSRMATAWLGETAEKNDVKAFVAISLPVGEGEAGKILLEALGKITIPVLDIYGSRDIDPVLGSVRQRAAMHRGGGAEYTQVQIEGANHFFVGVESELVGRVNGWLRRVVEVNN